MVLKINKVIFCCLILFVLFSCTSQKNYIYLQDKGDLNGKLLDTNITFNYKIKPNDYLYIKTVAIDQESPLSLNSNQETNNVSSEQEAYLNGYNVSDSGFIEMPLIGQVSVVGLSIDECQKAIQKKVNFYLKNSLVVVRLLNFNITLLGEVNQPGSYNVYKTKINILQAIGMAGDLTINGNRKQVVLVRQNNPEKIINIDLTDKNMLLSEYFYLLPNDIIYVKPNKSKLFGTNPFPFATVLSSVTTLILIINFLSK